MTKLSERIIKITTEELADTVKITVSQTEKVFHDPPTVFEFVLKGEFDKNLTLKSLSVDKMHGSRGAFCHAAKDGLKRLIGSQAGVGKGFMKKIKGIKSENFCMHFPSLLQQMAMAAFRSKQYKILKKFGASEFFKSNLKIFQGKCAGYASPQTSLPQANNVIEISYKKNKLHKPEFLPNKPLSKENRNAVNS